MPSLKSLIDKETKMIILNNPNNPTSKVIDSKNPRRRSRVSQQKRHNNPLRRSLRGNRIQQNQKHPRLRRRLQTHPLQRLLQNLHMTGWRIGYIVANKMFIDNVTKLNQITFNNVPVFIQDAALKGMELHKQIASNIKAKYKARADLASTKLSAAGFKFTKPDAPFYVFPKREGLDGEKFTLDLLDKGVAVAPGTSLRRLPRTLPHQPNSTRRPNRSWV